MRKAFLFLFLFISCAKFGPPPGGPEDKTPPEITGVSPLSGTVRVDTSAFLEFTLSKKVERTSLVKNLFISPALVDSFHDELKGKIYRVYPNRYLKKGITYVVTLGTGIRDLRGNVLAQAYTLSFSTGQTIDSGEIAGQLFEKTSSVGGALVKAFRISDSAVAIDWKKPDYQTTTGNDGRFKFSFLPSGRYRLLASAGEKFALYHREITASKIGAKEIPSQLFLEPADTAGLSLLSAQFNRDRLLVLTFNRPLNSSDTLLTNFRIVAPESVGLQSAFANPNEKDKLYLAASFPLKELEAKIYYSTASGKPTHLDSSVFLISASPDKTPPRLAWSEPKNRQGRIGFSDTLKFFFSEPVALASETALPSLYDSLNAAVSVVWSQPQANAFFFAPQKNLRPAEWYRFRFPAGSTVDRTDNAWTDSLWTAFQTYSPDSLGTVNGLAEGRGEDKIVLEFQELSSGWSKKAVVSDSVFSVPLLAGKYFLFGFVDTNGDQKREAGSLSPFAFPEPAFFYPDTIFVRSRFETEEVDISIR